MSLQYFMGLRCLTSRACSEYSSAIELRHLFLIEKESSNVFLVTWRKRRFSATRPFKKGLSAIEVDRRLVRLSRLHQRVESELCFYLREVDERRLYLKLGFASTLDYARERLGFEQRKAQSLLYMASRFQELPVLAKAFSAGELPWTKAREVVKVARPETEREWLKKCHEMSNRQLEQEVRRKLPPLKKLFLSFVLEGERIETWQQTREALERLAGKTLTDLEAFDLMCAEVLCTYATTPSFGVKDGEGEA